MESTFLTEATEKLIAVRSLEEVTAIVTRAARGISGSDAATFVLRDGDNCHYVDENSIAPLWKGQRFPMLNCISGWTMLHKEPVCIEDIYEDSRIPAGAYRPTFVKSLCLVPVRNEEPLGAIGCYWAEKQRPSEKKILLLQVLGNMAARALENLELKKMLRAKSEAHEDLSKRVEGFEIELHSLAHDLRGPLASIIGMADVLIGKFRHAPVSDRGYIQSILCISERLDRQINKLLALYRLSHDTIQRRETDLGAMAREIAEEISVRNPEQKIEFKIGESMKVNADADLMRLVLENLIGNACKFSSKREVSDVRFERARDLESDSCWAFTVVDNGIGFDQDESKQLFQPHHRLRSALEFPGTGLGLASVAKVVRLHGGKVAAAGAKGAGARFSFTLPR